MTLERPSRKTQCRVLYRGIALYGNVGSWAWVEGRAQLRVCAPCRTLYPPCVDERICPRHGLTQLVDANEFSLEPSDQQEENDDTDEHEAGHERS